MTPKIFGLKWMVGRVVFECLSGGTSVKEPAYQCGR